MGELERRDASRLGIVLMIETQAAFNSLPMLLLTSMRHPPMAMVPERVSGAIAAIERPRRIVHHLSSINS